MKEIIESIPTIVAIASLFASLMQLSMGKYKQKNDDTEKYLETIIRIYKETRKESPNPIITGMKSYIYPPLNSKFLQNITEINDSAKAIHLLKRGCEYLNIPDDQIKNITIKPATENKFLIFLFFSILTSSAIYLLLLLHNKTHTTTPIIFVFIFLSITTNCSRSNKNDHPSELNPTFLLSILYYTLAIIAFLPFILHILDFITPNPFVNTIFFVIEIIFSYICLGEYFKAKAAEDLIATTVNNQPPYHTA